MDELVEECGGDGLPLLRDLSEAILSECMTTEGVFRRTPGVSFVPTLGSRHEAETSIDPLASSTGRLA